MTDLPTIQLKKNEDRRVRRGHLWIFSNEVVPPTAPLPAGSAVRFVTDRKELLGVGFYNGQSLIAGRLVDRRDVPLDVLYFQNALRHAQQLRERLWTDTAYRWVYGESDDLPGLVIDRYGDVCVLASYCAGMDRLLPTITEALLTLGTWKAVVWRKDAKARELEHLETSVTVAHGAVESPHRFESDGLTLFADVREGQKTGFFFDQRQNRQTVAGFARGKRVLDLFCHTGGFGLWAARGGAAKVVGIDQSESALTLAGLSAAANHLDQISYIKADVEHWLGENKDTHDIVVVDPPRYAPSKKQLPQAIKAYIRLNTLAMGRVTGGGLLATSSCSGHVDREMFRQIIARAAQEANRRARILSWAGAAPDHPLRPSMPETDYLKFAVVHIS